MKKVLYTLAGLAMIALSAVSCQKEASFEAGKDGNVTFTVQLPSNDTKAISDGTTATKLDFAIYDGDGKYLQELTESATVSEFFGKKATVSVQVIKDLTYQFVFFAEAASESPYTFKAAEKKLSIAYGAANLEAADAFYFATEPITVEGAFSRDIRLTRPLAQINFGSSTSDIDAANLSKIDVNGLKSSLVLTNVYSEMDLLTGNVAGEPTATVTLTEAAKPAEVLNVNKTKYGWIAMAYILADDKDVTNLTLGVKTTADGKDVTITRKVANVPYQRNHRTNILGNIFSYTASFNIEIDSNFDEPDYTNVTPAWSGSDDAELDLTKDEIIITTGEELAQLATLVNNGTSFAGKTVKLGADINLANLPWTPIGGPQDYSYSNYFNGDFDGQGHTIYNLNVNANKTVGLFGRIHQGHSIKNVNIDGFELNSNHFAGAIVGWVEGNSNVIIENCSVKNGKITVKAENTGSEWDNGDKAGAIAGFFHKSQILNCSAENITISAYRDLGGIVGHSNGSTITGNSVKNITLIQDNSQDYKGYDSFEKYNVHEIVGRIGEAGTISDNTYENVTIIRQVAEGVTTDGTGNYTVDGTEGALAAALAAIEADETNTNPVIKLTADSAPLSYPARKTYGNDKTESITFDGDGHVLNLYQTDTDWSSISGKNGKLIFKNATINKTKRGGNNAWNNYAWNINGDVVIENSTINISTAVRGKAEFKNVKFVENGNYYGVLIVATVADVKFDNCVFSIPNGRGIKVIDQYVDEGERKQVNISVSGCKFTTAHKAAVLVTNTAGAKIIWGKGNDISGVAADTENAVWNDADRSDAWDLVEVTGCTKKQE